MISDETRRTIDGMPRAELVAEVDRENRSRFQGDSYAYLKTRLALLDEEDRTAGEGRRLQLAEEANRIASEANDISRAASSTAAKAYRMSAMAVFVALLSIIITVVAQCTKS